MRKREEERERERENKKKKKKIERKKGGKDGILKLIEVIKVKD